MEHETKIRIDFTIAEVWQPTMLLRLLEKDYHYIELSMALIKTKTTLQQLYTSNLGKKEWKDIPTVIQL